MNIFKYSILFNSIWEMDQSKSRKWYKLREHKPCKKEVDPAQLNLRNLLHSI